MPVEILMPKIGMSTEPIRLVEWKFKEGDEIKKGAPALVVETEKITYDVEATASGFLHIVIEAGQEVAIGRVTGLIAETREELAVLQKGKPGEEITAAAGVSESPAVEPAHVEAAAEAIADTTTPPATAEEYQGKKVKDTIPLRGWRKTMASRMHQSQITLAPVSIMGEIDMTEMVKAREALVSQEKTIGTRISYNDLFVLALAKVLKSYPLLNSSLIGDEIKLWESINIGVAVGSEGKLIVPVIRDADKKSLREISLNAKDLAKKAREGRLTIEEVTGATFTITNMGPMNVVYRFYTILINPPEAAIWGTNTIRDRAVVRDGKIVIRPIMSYVISYDHRINEGTLAAEFVASLTSLIENPAPLLDQVT